MKFRRLSNEELGHLEKEFVDFLCANTITAEDWVKIKSESLEKAEHLIEMFSDIVLEKVYNKVSFLEKREAKNLIVFRCTDKTVDLIGITLDPNSNLDLTDPEKVADVVSGKYSLKDQLSGFRNTKKINSEEKSLEVHQLINSGCIIGEEKLFLALDRVIK